MNKLTRFSSHRDLLSDLQEDINRLMSPFGRRTELAQSEMSGWPEIDIKDEPKQLLIHADVPGVKKEDIDVNIKDGILTIKGHRKSEVKEEKENYLRVERSKGSFTRSFTLPDNIDTSKVKATTKNGVLEIILPKTEKASGAHQVEIHEE